MAHVSGSLLNASDAERLIGPNRHAIMAAARRGALPCVKTELGRLYRAADIAEYGELAEPRDRRGRSAPSRAGDAPGRPRGPSGASWSGAGRGAGPPARAAASPSGAAPVKVDDFMWTWIGTRLVGLPIGRVDPRSLVVRHVTPDELVREFGIGDEEPPDGATHPGADDSEADR